MEKKLVKLHFPVCAWCLIPEAQHCSYRHTNCSWGPELRERARGWTSNIWQKFPTNSRETYILLVCLCGCWPLPKGRELKSLEPSGLGLILWLSVSLRMLLTSLCVLSVLTSKMLIITTPRIVVKVRYDDNKCPWLVPLNAAYDHRPWLSRKLLCNYFIRFHFTLLIGNYSNNRNRIC